MSKSAAGPGPKLPWSAGFVVFLGIATQVFAVGDVRAETTASSAAPADWQSTVTAEIAKSEYRFSAREDGALSAPNRAHDLRSTITPGGLELTSRVDGESGFKLTLDLIGQGRGKRVVRASAGTLTQDERGATIARGVIREWYVNDERGLEQGFTLSSRPQGSKGNAAIELKLGGNVLAYPDPTGQSIVFKNAKGEPVLRYSELHVVDVIGRGLPASMVVKPGILRIEFDDKGAAYPVVVDPLATSPAWTAETDQANSQFGFAVATAGDVNGDGFSDVIVSALLYDNGQTDEGRAFVYLGSAAGLATSAAWTAESNQANSQFGYSVATAGDVNGDGYTDVIVGAPQYANGQQAEGRAYVYHGSAAGLSASPAWTVESNQGLATLGFSVATAGDVNGDGYADVIVGAPDYDNVEGNEGRAFVYLGSPAGLSTIPAWTAESDQNFAAFGFSVATAGDVNGDGYADVIVGAHTYDNGQPNEGRAYVFHGSAAGLSAGPAWTAESDQGDAFFGQSVATAGDVNGDGYADVIVGAIQYNGGQLSEGRAYVYHGSSTGLSASPAWTAESDQANADFGMSVATAGDVNGDGYADVIVGSHWYSNPQVEEGRAYMYLGSASGLAASASWTVESDQSVAHFGQSLAPAGDVNGDGYGDVIVGAPRFDNGQSDEGRAFVYYGSASGLATSSSWTAESDQSGSLFGESISSAGDVNGDGYDDVIVGAGIYENGESSEGRAYLYLGSAAGLSTSPAWIAESNRLIARFGRAVAGAGDVNGDGYDDVIVGAYAYTNDQPEEGRVFVYLGSASGLSATPAWTAEDDQDEANFGIAVGTAGDVNGDGYADVIVGASEGFDGQTLGGKGYLYLGSASGLASSPAWTAHSEAVWAYFGASVSTAGDVNGDGYSDVIVGAPAVQSVGGKAYLYLGSPSGLATSPSWTAEGGQVNANFGISVSTAGDVNGDGYADVIVGASQFQNGQSWEGRAFVYLGSPSGLASNAVWTTESDQANAGLGYAVSRAGDVNGDGYADVIVGASGFSNGQSGEGRAFVFLGSPSGLASSPAWTAESDQVNAGLGRSVGTAGDVNGDGRSDVVVGATGYSNDQPSEGRAFLYYGNGGGLSRLPRQRRSDNAAAIAPLGTSDVESAFRLAALARTPAGRDRVKLQWQVKPLGTPFDGSGIQSGTSLDTGIPLVGSGSAAPIDTLVSGLTPGTPYTWRVRVASSNPFFPCSPWFSLQYNGPRETDLRTAAASPPSVVAVVPQANQFGVERSTNATVTFSELVNPATVTSATFRLLDPLGTPVVAGPPAVSPTGLQFTLNPAAPLAADTLYTVQVTSGVADLVGIPAVAFTSHFRTGSSGDSSPLPDTTATSPLPTQAKGGSSVSATGDLNGDGILDFVSGAPGFEDAAHSVPLEAGAALVYLGSASASERAQPDIIFTGVAAHDRAGVSVSGNFDFNGDGMKDLVIGAEQVDRATNPNLPAATGNGKVYLIFFDPTDTTHYPNLGNSAVPDTVSLSLVGQSGGIPGVVFTGAAFGDQAGFSVAGGGKFTLGGGTGIVIGAPGADPGGRTDAGAAYVVLDNPALSGNVSLTRISSGLPDQIPGRAFFGDAAGDNAGFATAFAGAVVQGQSPFGGTVLIGAPGVDGGRGKVIAPPEDPDTTPIIVDAIGTTHSGFQIRGTQPGEQLGFAVADGGDALADGVPDLLIGAPNYDAGVKTDAGRALQTSQAIPSGVYSADSVGTTIQGVIWTGAASGDELGSAVAGVGDVNGDGYDDIVLGAPFVDPVVAFATVTDAGAVYVVDGVPATGFLGTQSVADVGTLIAGERLTGTEAGENAGSSIAATGDINGDGQDDFVVGAPNKDDDAGTTYMIVDTAAPPPGTCGPESDCLVSDLNNGAQLQAAAGTLAAPVTIGVTGILVPAALPGAVPSGKLLLGAAEFDPEGQSFSSPYATIQVPTVAALEAQLTNLESLPVSYWTGSSWASAGFNGAVVTNPQYALRKAVSAVADVAHVYAVLLDDTDGDGIRDQRDNCPVVANALQGNADGDALGDACDPCTDTDADGFGNPGFAANTCAIDNCPNVSNPIQTDSDGDGVGTSCDNCPTVANPSQGDLDADNVGDACDTDPRLTVSSNGADEHDFTTIQAAVNAAVQSGTRIRILPGNGPYIESVVVNRNFAFAFEGVDDVAHTPVIVDGGGGIAFDIPTTAPGGRVSFDNLTIRGATGVRSAVSTSMEDLTFEQATALAVDLNGGTHTLDRIRMGSTVASGIDTAPGVSLTLRNSRFESLSGTALRLGGPSTAETVLVGGGAGDAVVTLSTATLTLRHATIAGNGGKGVDNAASGAVTIAHAIVQDNAGGDIANVACSSISWSNVKSQDCTGTGNDLHTSCSLAVDYRQSVSSSCLDYGPSPATFAGSPCLDLDGGPRLRDHDGNGLATIDPGAFERENVTLTPAAVPNLRFTSKTILQWDADPSGQATEYHVYRDLRTNLSYGNFGVCRDDLDANRADLVLTDAASPAPGQTFSYVITAGRPAAPTQPDREGTMGLDRCMERSNFNACP